MSSKILMYTGATTGVTTSVGQHAFFINENGLPTVKSGSQTIVFSTSGAAFTGSSGSSGANGSSGASGTSGVSGTSGQDGATGETGAAGTSGSSGESGSSGINGIDGLTALLVDGAYTSGSNVYTNNASAIDSYIYPIAHSGVYFITDPLAFYSETESFTGYTNSYAVSQPIQLFAPGKKLNSVTINRTANYSPIPTGKTECETVSAYLKIYKGEIASSGVLAYSLAKTIDLDGIVNFNTEGGAVSETIDISADNIYTNSNQYIFAAIERTTDVCDSTSKLINIPGINLYFESTASNYQ